MSYIGKTPTSVPLTSSDITDGIISTDKLAANAVVTSKITDATISNADVNATVVTGQTALTSVANDDLILLSDTSASGALKKMTVANLVANAGGGKVLQVVQTSKTDTFTTTSTSYTDITGMSVAITPSATSSKILVLVDLKFCITGQLGMLTILRGSTQIYLGDAGSSRPRVTQAIYSPDPNAHFSSSSCFLDTPNTTDATTYKLQVKTMNSSYLLAVNRGQNDDDQTDRGRSASSITVIEIGA